jgi:hypothetical protein
MAALTNDELVQLEEHASLMFSIREIALILGFHEAVLRSLVSDEKRPEYVHFNRGRLLAEAKIRKSIYDLANNGSSPAQTQFLELIDDAKLDDAL